MIKTEDIQIRDPFVFPNDKDGRYYLFGSTDKNIWDEPGEGFDCYQSKDLSNWEGPIPAFRPPQGFWGYMNFWAPEVHWFHGTYYMFASFKGKVGYRGTQILESKTIVGPYQPLTDGPVTPPDWQCLDGTLFVDEQGTPWIVFCHEWVQVHNGAIYAQALSPDLKRPVSPPVISI